MLRFFIRMHAERRGLADLRSLILLLPVIPQKKPLLVLMVGVSEHDAMNLAESNFELSILNAT